MPLPNALARETPTAMDLDETENPPNFYRRNSVVAFLGCFVPSRTFVLIVVDRDSGDFTVEGPMTDDRPWNRAVVEAQRRGRNLRCFSMGDITPDAAAAEWQMMHGGRRIAAGSIVALS